MNLHVKHVKLQWDRVTRKRSLCVNFVLKLYTTFELMKRDSKSLKAVMYGLPKTYLIVSDYKVQTHGAGNNLINEEPFGSEDYIQYYTS